MTLLRSVAHCSLVLLALTIWCTVETLKQPAQIMMYERRRAFCSPETNPSDDEAFIKCNECKADIERLKHVLKHEINYGKRFNIATRFCNKFVAMFGHNAKAHCPKLLNSYLDSIEYVIHVDMLPDVCHIMGLCPDEDLQFCSNQGAKEISIDSNPELGYREDIITREDDHYNGGTGDYELSNEEENAFHNLLGETSSNITFVQISDIHFDPEYAEGACTNCLQVACCHKLFGEDEDGLGAGRAGAFGDFHCDVPERTVRAILDFVRSLSPPPDFIVYVGDSSVHAILETMRQKLDDNRAVTNLLVEKLGDIGPIYPVFGNHETVPQSFYFRPLRNFQTILSSLGEQWPTMFNTTEEQIATIREHGYYVAEINPTLWILNFNCLYSYLTNVFALLGRLDPVWCKQKDFLRKTLERARGQNAKVIFTSHMKPRSESTYPEYADYLDSLMADFGDVIILQLYGHDHDDSFLLHRDPDNRSRLVGTSLAAPSLTPFYALREGVNPSIRVFTLEKDTWTPLDYTQYYADLEEANNEGEITMKLQYRFTEEYNLPDLSPASFASLSDRIYTDWSDFQKYERNYLVLTNGRERCAEDDTECRRSLACHTRTAKPCDYAACLRGE